jgi:hypothetical protein
MLNWSGDPLRDLDQVVEMYQSVARDRLEALKSNRPRGLYAGDEFEAYPIVFLYRQALELSLKAIAFAGAALLREEGEDPMPLKTLMRHELMPLFKEAVRVFKHMGWKDVWNLGDSKLMKRSDFERVIREFDSFDPGSYTFRYTVKTDGTTPSVDRGFEFDLFVFGETMDRILAFLVHAPECIREAMQERWEAAYEAQQEAWANFDDEPA